MAHREQFDFFESLRQNYKNFFHNVSVLEIGSLNVNGTVRDFFQNSFYIGVDVAPGECVDVVCFGHEYNLPDNTFDVVISTESFEHDPYWKETFINMIRLCKQQGLVIITCATDGRAVHGTYEKNPESSLTVEIGLDYYKNLIEKDFDIFSLKDLFSMYNFSSNSNSHDLYFYGFKK